MPNKPFDSSKSGNLETLVAVLNETLGDEARALLCSKDTAFERLFDPDPQMRAAAVVAYELYWHGGSDKCFLDACEKMAQHDTDSSVRFHTISSIGNGYEGSRNERISKLLAGIIKGSASESMVREVAYRALRQIQIGQMDIDAFEGIFSLAKILLQKHPCLIEQKDLAPLFLLSRQRGWLERHQEIDWDFVNQFA